MDGSTSRAGSRIARVILAPEISEIAGSVRARLPELVDRVVQRLLAEIEFYRDREVVSLQDLRDSVASNLESMVAQLTTDRPPDLSAPRETGRRRAEQGTPLADILHAYRIGFTELWGGDRRGGPPRRPGPLRDARRRRHRRVVADRRVHPGAHRRLPGGRGGAAARRGPGTLGAGGGPVHRGDARPGHALGGRQAASPALGGRVRGGGRRGARAGPGGPARRRGAAGRAGNRVGLATAPRHPDRRGVAAARGRPARPPAAPRRRGARPGRRQPPLPRAGGHTPRPPLRPAGPGQPARGRPGGGAVRADPGAGADRAGPAGPGGGPG
jgi:hypothetical protein